MPETIEVVVKKIDVLTAFSGEEIKKLHTALNMCEGGPGRDQAEAEAWDYFTQKFYPYIDQLFNEVVKGQH